MTITPAVSVATAFDPATGATLWSTTLPGGGLTDGPAVRPDGSVVLLTYYAVTWNSGYSTLVSLDPSTGHPTGTRLSTPTTLLYGVTLGGVAIVGADLLGVAATAGLSTTGLAAIARDGTFLWTSPFETSPLLYGICGSPIIAGDGTVVSFGPKTIHAIDPSGAIKWEVSPPGTATCLSNAACPIADGTLTSDGAIVAMTCDGTLFRASD
jgi:outer membrane protein assembly factor BamB